MAMRSAHRGRGGQLQPAEQFHQALGRTRRTGERAIKIPPRATISARSRSESMLTLTYSPFNGRPAGPPASLTDGRQRSLQRHRRRGFRYSTAIAARTSPARPPDVHKCQRSCVGTKRSSAGQGSNGSYPRAAESLAVFIATLPARGGIGPASGAGSPSGIRDDSPPRD